MKNKTEILSEFRKSIRCGTGKAYLLMSKYHHVNFTNEIYKATIRNYAYDGQTEGARSEYLIQFFKKLTFKQQDFIKNKLVERLFVEKEDTWDLLQVFNLCAYFAKTDRSVKKAIYKRFRQTHIKDSDWLGTEAILELDGANGMIAIAKHFGKKLKKDKECWQDDSILNKFDENNPELNIKNILKQEAKRCHYIDAYLKEIHSTQKRWDKYKKNKEKWTFDRIIDHLIDDNKRGPMFFVIRKLSKFEIKQIAKILTNNPSEETINKLLYVFTQVKYPYSIDHIKEYTKEKYLTHIRDNAFEALSFFKDEEIRDFAISRLNKTNNPSKYLNILKSNYKEGDSKIITKTILKFNNKYIIEQIAISLCEIYNLNNTRDCKKPLIAVYEKMNCAIHRYTIIEIMYKNKVLSNSILNEIKFDSYEETRKLYQKIEKKTDKIN